MDGSAEKSAKGQPWALRAPTAAVGAANAEGRRQRCRRRVWRLALPPEQAGWPALPAGATAGITCCLESQMATRTAVTTHVGADPETLRSQGARNNQANQAQIRYLRTCFHKRRGCCSVRPCIWLARCKKQPRQQSTEQRSKNMLPQAQRLTQRAVWHLARKVHEKTKATKRRTAL